MMRSFLGITLSALTGFTAPSFPAEAKITEKDTLVIARLIGQLQDMPEGEMQVAIVATPDANVQSDVNDFLQLAGSGKQVGDIKIRAIKVAPEEITSTSAKVLLIPKGLTSAHLDKVFDVAEQRKLVTISTSDECLMQKRCSIAIKTEPAVDIKMSSSATKATGVKFGSTFRMIIKEVP